MGEARIERLTPLRFTSDAVIVGSCIGACGALLALAFRAAVNASASLGRHVPFQIGERDYLWGVATAIGLGLILAVITPRRHRGAMAVAWAIKCLVALGLMLVYEGRYDVLDSYDYFYSAVRLPNAIGELSFGTGTILVEVLADLLYPVVGNSYHGMKIVFSFIGMVGILVLSTSIEKLSGKTSAYTPLLVACVPTVTFWTSIVGKDPIVFLGLALFCYALVSMSKGEFVWGGVSLLAAILSVGAIRVWLIGVIACALAGFVIAQRMSVAKRVILSAGGAAFSLVAWKLLSERFLEGRGVSVLVRLADISQDWARGGSAQVIEQDISSLSGFISFLPSGVITALLRPLPYEAPNVFALVSSVESVAVVLGVAWAYSVIWRDSHLRTMLAWNVAFAVSWLVLYAPISYQNLGTAVRFRLQLFTILILPIAAALLRRFGTPQLSTSPPVLGEL